MSGVDVKYFNFQLWALKKPHKRQHIFIRVCKLCPENCLWVALSHHLLKGLLTLWCFFCLEPPVSSYVLYPGSGFSGCSAVHPTPYFLAVLLCTPRLIPSVSSLSWASAPSSGLDPVLFSMLSSWLPARPPPLPALLDLTHLQGLAQFHPPLRHLLWLDFTLTLPFLCTSGGLIENTPVSRPLASLIFYSKLSSDSSPLLLPPPPNNHHCYFFLRVTMINKEL